MLYSSVVNMDQNSFHPLFTSVNSIVFFPIFTLFLYIMITFLVEIQFSRSLLFPYPLHALFAINPNNSHLGTFAPGINFTFLKDKTYTLLYYRSTYYYMIYMYITLLNNASYTYCELYERDFKSIARLSWHFLNSWRSVVSCWTIRESSVFRQNWLYIPVAKCTEHQLLLFCICAISSVFIQAYHLSLE